MYKSKEPPPKLPQQSHPRFNPTAASFNPCAAVFQPVQPTTVLPQVPRASIPSKPPVAVVGLGGNMAPISDADMDLGMREAGSLYTYGLRYGAGGTTASVMPSPYSFLNDRISGGPSAVPDTCVAGVPEHSYEETKPEQDGSKTAGFGLVTGDSERYQHHDSASSSGETIVATEQHSQASNRLDISGAAIENPPAIPDTQPSLVFSSNANTEARPTAYPINEIFHYLPPHITAPALRAHGGPAFAISASPRDQQYSFRQPPQRPPPNAPTGPRQQSAHYYNHIDRQTHRRKKGGRAGRRPVKRSDQGPEPSAADIYPEDATHVGLSVNTNSPGSWPPLPSQVRQTSAPPPPVFHPQTPRKLDGNGFPTTPAIPSVKLTLGTPEELQVSLLSPMESSPLAPDFVRGLLAAFTMSMAYHDGSPLSTAPTSTVYMSPIAEAPKQEGQLRRSILDYSQDTAPLSAEQVNGSKYGLSAYGLGLDICGDDWTPPHMDPGSFVTRKGDKEMRSIWAD